MNAIIIFVLASGLVSPALADHFESLQKAAASSVAEMASCAVEAAKNNASLQGDKASVWCSAQYMIVHRPERSAFDDSVTVLTTVNATTLNGDADGETLLGFACREHKTTVALMFGTQVQSRVQYRIGKDVLVNETWIATGNSVLLQGSSAIRFIKKLRDRVDDDLLVRVFHQSTEERRFKLKGVDKASDFISAACGWK